jgi:hypothetical protein
VFARLLGMREVERGTGYVVVRFPIWASERVIQGVVKNTLADAKVAGRHLTAEIGHRLVRFEGDVEKGWR